MTDTINKSIGSIATTEFEKLLLLHSHADIAKIYGTTRQNVNRVYQKHIKNGDMDESFLHEAIGTHSYSKNNRKHELKIISFNTEKKRVLLSVDGKLPRWIKVHRSIKGYYVNWSVRDNNDDLKIMRVHLDCFTVLDEDAWKSFDISYRYKMSEADESGNYYPYLVYEDGDKNSYQLKMFSEGYTVRLLKNDAKTNTFTLGETLYDGNSFKRAVATLKSYTGEIEIPDIFLSHIEKE